MVSIKPEVIQITGAVLAFAPQALFIKDYVTDVIPPEVVPLGYLLLTVGFLWDIILMLKK